MKPTGAQDLDARPTARKWASPVVYSLQRTLLPVLQRYARGAVLDAGCGGMPYRGAIESKVTSYDGLDIAPRTEDVRFVCSVTDMSPVSSMSYDTVLCSEVLEHVSDPAAAVSEIARVLRPGGTLIATVPFLFGLHDEPYDFQRYTEHGLRLLLDNAGFDAPSIQPTGWIASTVAHKLSRKIVLSTWHLPVARWPMFALNLAFVVLPALALDRLMKRYQRQFPLGYVVVATKHVG